MTTYGKYRHFTRTTSKNGHFIILAIDHRGNLVEKLNQHAPNPLTDDEFADFKQHILKNLTDVVSAVLMDPVYVISHAITSNNLTGKQGLLAPIEVTDYSIHPSVRDTEFIPDWSIAKLKRVGGDGVKLLLPYHPDATIAQAKRELVERVVAECTEQDIPFYLEPITYSLDPDTPLAGDEHEQLVPVLAKTFVNMGVDVLKLQFPVDAKHSQDEAHWQKACANLTEVCGDVPWALLSAGVDYETFARQTRVACQNGATGVIAGRAIWTEAIAMQGEERLNFLQTTALERMVELANICTEHATSVFDYIQPPSASTTWFEG